VSSLPTLIINLFSNRDDFLFEAFRLESRLSMHGQISSTKGSGVAQITLRTRKSLEEIREEINHLSLKGDVRCNEEENDKEMSPA